MSSWRHHDELQLCAAPAVLPIALIAPPVLKEEFPQRPQPRPNMPPIRLTEAIWEWCFVEEERGGLQWLSEILRNGHRVDFTTLSQSNDTTPMHLAFGLGRKNSVLFLENFGGVRLNMRVIEGRSYDDYLTMLSYVDANLEERLELVDILIARQFPFNGRYGPRQTNILGVLLQKNAPQGQLDRQKEFAIPCVMKLLAANVVDVNASIEYDAGADYYGFTPLMYAVQQIYDEAVDLLFEDSRLNINATSLRGGTALMTACHVWAFNGNYAVRIMVKGANVNAQMNADVTAHITALHILLRIGALMYPRNFNSERTTDFKNILTQMKRSGVDTSIKNKDGFTAMDVAENVFKNSADTERATVHWSNFKKMVTLALGEREKDNGEEEEDEQIKRRKIAAAIN